VPHGQSHPGEVQFGAVVLTHGHLDHTFSVLPVCEGYDIPAYLHPRDFGMLADPAPEQTPEEPEKSADQQAAP
jgi:glyoxylase-like metal-dependent hydrolase (beta-lactamase superfamily II)